LLFEEFALSGDVAAVAFCGDVFAHGRDGFAGDDVSSDSGLDGDDEHLGGDDFFELGGEFAAAVDGFVTVDDGGEGFDGIAGDEHVHFDHLGGAVAGVLVGSLKSTRMSARGTVAVRRTRNSSMVSVFSRSPRFSMMSCMASPM